MFSINKQSHLVTVSSEIKLSDIKKFLIQESLYFGYYPLDDIHYTINHYLKRRILNLYHYKYGSLSDLVSSALVELPNGKSFHLKDAPRSAIGPDFNKLIVGSKNHFGTIKTVTLKLVAMPEKILHGIVLVNNREEAKNFIRQIVGNHISPLYFRYFDLNSAPAFLDDLKIKKEPLETLLFSLSGLKEMVETEQEYIEDYFKKCKKDFFWIDKTWGHDFIQAYLHSPESYREIKEQYRHFLWPATDNTSQLNWEKEFFKF